MKKTWIIAIFLLACLPGCKKENWVDWKIQNQAWLINNAKQSDIRTTPTGLQYKVIRAGIDGTKPDALKTVLVNYTGKLITGDVFESTDSATFAVSGVIDGLQEGLKKMKKSGHYIFYIPAELAYGDKAQGEKGYSSYIPPYSTLIFDVELLDVY